MAFKHPFGKPQETVEADNTTQSDATPQQKKFEKATGKSHESPTGDPTPKKKAPKEEGTTDEPVGKGEEAPSGVNKDVWMEARKAVLGQTGGFAGVGPEGRTKQIQAYYDQMVENDKKAKAWEGKE